MENAIRGCSESVTWAFGMDFCKATRSLIDGSDIYSELPCNRSPRCLGDTLAGNLGNAHSGTRASSLLPRRSNSRFDKRRPQSGQFTGEELQVKFLSDFQQSSLKY